MTINLMPTKEVPNVKQSGTLGTSEHHKAMSINPMPTKEVPNVTQSRTLGTNRHHKAMTINPMQTEEVPNVTQAGTLGTKLLLLLYHLTNHWLPACSSLLKPQLNHGTGTCGHSDKTAADSVPTVSVRPLRLLRPLWSLPDSRKSGQKSSRGRPAAFICPQSLAVLNNAHTFRDFDYVLTRRTYGKGHQNWLPVFPFKVYGCTSTHFEPFKTSGRPFGRKGGKDIDESLVALEQHFRYTGRTPEIAVYLERRMRAEQIRICPRND